MENDGDGDDNDNGDYANDNDNFRDDDDNSNDNDDNDDIDDIGDDDDDDNSDDDSDDNDDNDNNNGMTMIVMVIPAWFCGQTDSKTDLYCCFKENVYHIIFILSLLELSLLCCHIHGFKPSLLNSVCLFPRPRFRPSSRRTTMVSSPSRCKTITCSVDQEITV